MGWGNPTSPKHAACLAPVLTPQHSALTSVSLSSHPCQPQHSLLSASALSPVSWPLCEGGFPQALHNLTQHCCASLSQSRRGTSRRGISQLTACCLSTFTPFISLLHSDPTLPILKLDEVALLIADPSPLKLH